MGRQRQMRVPDVSIDCKTDTTVWSGKGSKVNFFSSGKPGMPFSNVKIAVFCDFDFAMVFCLNFHLVTLRYSILQNQYVG